MVRQAPPAAAASTSRRGLFAEPDFRRLWFVGLVVFLVRWLETLVIGLFTWNATGSAFLVATMTMLRMLPMGLFGAFLGALAERVEGRTALLATVGASLLSSLAAALLAAAGALEVWHLGALSFVNGLAWAADNPVRRVMIGQAVGAERMGFAMSVDVGTNNASRLLGPTLGGAILAGMGIGGAFSVSVALYAAAFVVALAVRRRAAPRPAFRRRRARARRRGLRGGAAGPAAARAPSSSPSCSTCSAGPTTAWCRWSRRSTCGSGRRRSACSSAWTASAPSRARCWSPGSCRPRPTGGCYLGGMALYLVTVALFALAPHPLAAGAALVMNGLVGSGFSIMQATLVYLASPPELRSRVLGILSVCIGLGPIGFAHIGLLADTIGARGACVLSAAEGLLALALTRRWWRGL